MPIQSVRFLVPLLPLLVAVGCGGGSSTHDTPILPQATLQFTGQFEKQTLTATGQSSAVLLPARYCYAEVRQVGTDALLASGYLGAGGTGSTQVDVGTRVYARLYPTVEVPGATSSDYFFHGSVKNGVTASSYSDAAAFNGIPDWSVTSATLTVTGDTTLTLQALASTSEREAGAFNLADQLVSFGQAVQVVEPTLRLPNLHLFWQASGQAQTGYPAAALSKAGSVLQQPSKRAIFQMSVRGRMAGSAEVGADETNDGLVQQRLASLLFAPYSYPEDGSQPSSIIRSDNDYFGRTDRGIQGESSAAFITGFCDFFSAAVRNNPTIIDVDSRGVRSVFRLDSHVHAARTANQGEFYSDAVAISLYGIWTKALGGGFTTLPALWQPILATTPNAYLNAPLGSYPTYLTGLKAKLPATQWNLASNELALEDIADVTSASYFGDPATPGIQPLWITVGKPFTRTGALATYDPADPKFGAVYYDRNQAEAYRFVQPASGPLTVTMTPVDGQDFFVELIGPTGIVLGSYDQRNTASTRTLTATSLPAGTYVVRVKAGYTSATLSAARYSLTVN